MICNDLLSVKMRASRQGTHVSGAEKIVLPRNVPTVVAELAARALSHPKGTPDFINLKVEAPGEILTLESLPVTTYTTATEAEGRAKAAELLRGVGIVRIDEIMARFAETNELRGAMLLDADTLERLEPDSRRGVRATYMDDAQSLRKGTARGKNHYAEAIVLATKVQAAPHIVGEICVSDDPDYVTGYVATKEIGYCRITTIKTKGSPAGGRIFLYRGPKDGLAETIRFLEKQAVIVTGVPVLEAGGAPTAGSADRWTSLVADLEAMRSAGLERRLPTAASAPDVENGDTPVCLASNDYLGLKDHPAVKRAAATAALVFGAGSGGSRLTTGNQAAHEKLEAHLARFKGTDAALVWATGYMANVGTISALVTKGDVIFSDALNHASIIDGCRLSGAEVVIYAHNNLDDLAAKLAADSGHRRRLVVSDAVFSMDGDQLNLPRFLAICRAHDAFSMIDEAHATGVLGPTGRGLAEAFACAHADITLGTLSKALGAEGGFVCGSRILIDYLRNKSRSFIFSTAPGAAAMAAADAALTVLENEPDRVARLTANVAFFVGELARRGIVVETQSAIVPIVIGDERRALAVSERLKAGGFLISAIRYPTVAKGRARFRVALSSAHTEADLARAARAIADALTAGEGGAGDCRTR